jgi:hypothetical protein
VVDPARKMSCRDDFKLFCKTYMPKSFTAEWGPDRTRITNHFELAVEDSLWTLVVVDHGIGSTTIVEAGALWLALYGRSWFTATIHHSRRASEALAENIKSECLWNDLLLEDFPEAIYPIRKLDGITQRAAFQTCDGSLTSIEWRGDVIRFPSIKGSPASGCVIQSFSIMGAFVGVSTRAGPEMTRTRPTFVFVDDPFDAETLRSATMCMHRKATLAGEVSRLGARGPKTAGMSIFSKEAFDLIQQDQEGKVGQ